MIDDIKGQNKKYYDTESIDYDNNRYGPVSGQRVEAFHKRILDRLLAKDLSSGSSVLEMGCGTGRLLHHLASKELLLHGIDMSDGMLAVAKKRLSEEKNIISLKKTTANDMPFENATFDAVYSILL